MDALLAVISHDYFWLSFAPVSFLGVGFWLLFFDRARKQEDPLVLLYLALGAGVLSALLFLIWQDVLHIGAPDVSWGNLIAGAFLEELCKVILAIAVMEMVKARFHTVAGGVVYGFAVGLGFALAENILYLAAVYDTQAFTPTFWLAFQGRFWTSTILHGLTTALFGLYYAGAYLAKTVHKQELESPLRVFFVPPSWYSFTQIISLHVTRRHLLLSHHPTLHGHTARAVLLEGVLVCSFVHIIYNVGMQTGRVEFSFLLALLGMFFLRRKVEKVSHL